MDVAVKYTAFILKCLALSSSYCGVLQIILTEYLINLIVQTSIFGSYEPYVPFRCGSYLCVS